MSTQASRSRSRSPIDTMIRAAWLMTFPVLAVLTNGPAAHADTLGATLLAYARGVCVVVTGTTFV